MKWLYRILRLFMCPHRWIDTGHRNQKYVTILSTGQRHDTFMFRIYECRYCGKTREQK